jgi:hypothetical protein
MHIFLAAFYLTSLSMLEWRKGDQMHDRCLAFLILRDYNRRDCTAKVWRGMHRILKVLNYRLQDPIHLRQDFTLDLISRDRNKWDQKLHTTPFKPSN